MKTVVILTESEIREAVLRYIEDKIEEIGVETKVHRDTVSVRIHRDSATGEYVAEIEGVM